MWQTDGNGPFKILKGHEHVVETLNFINNENSKFIIKEAEYISNKEEFKSEELLLSGSRDREIRLWNIIMGECLYVFTGHDNWIRGIEIHPTGKYMYSCSDDKSIRIWDMKNGKNIKKYQDAHNHFISTMAFCPRFMVLVSGSYDYHVKVWELK